MRGHFVWVKYARPKDGFSGRWVSIDKLKKSRRTNGVMVLGDLEDYRSVITGETISGRRAHRDHLKQHGCIEVGNEFVPPSRTELPPVADDIRRAIEQPLPSHVSERLKRESERFNSERIYAGRR